MSTQRDPSKDNEPHPREPFGQPTTGQVDRQVSDQKPGHDPSPPPAESAEKAGQDREPAVLPPFKPDAASRVPLAERIRQQPASQEEESK